MNIRLAIILVFVVSIVIAGGFWMRRKMLLQKDETRNLLALQEEETRNLLALGISVEEVVAEQERVSVARSTMASKALERGISMEDIVAEQGRASVARAAMASKARERKQTSDDEYAMQMQTADEVTQLANRVIELENSPHSEWNQVTTQLAKRVVELERLWTKESVESAKGRLARLALEKVAMGNRSNLDSVSSDIKELYRSGTLREKRIRTIEAAPVKSWADEMSLVAPQKRTSI